MAVAFCFIADSGVAGFRLEPGLFVETRREIGYEEQILGEFCNLSFDICGSFVRQRAGADD
jgi:hypothetical protein